MKWSVMSYPSTEEAASSQLSERFRIRFGFLLTKSTLRLQLRAVQIPAGTVRYKYFSQVLAVFQVDTSVLYSCACYP